MARQKDLQNNSELKSGLTFELLLLYVFSAGHMTFDQSSFSESML